MALVISAAGGRQLRQTEHLHRWLAVTHKADAKLTRLWISERRQVLQRQWSQVTNESTRWDGAQGGETASVRSEVEPLWNWEAVGAASTGTPRIVTNCSLHFFFYFFYYVPPLGGVWGILRPGRWSHHGVNRRWWCMRDITSTSKPPALLSYFSQGGAEWRYAQGWTVVC